MTFAQCSRDADKICFTSRIRYMLRIAGKWHTDECGQRSSRLASASLQSELHCPLFDKILLHWKYDLSAVTVALGSVCAGAKLIWNFTVHFCTKARHVDMHEFPKMTQFSCDPLSVMYTLFTNIHVLASDHQTWWPPIRSHKTFFFPVFLFDHSSFWTLDFGQQRRKLTL